MEYEHDKHYVDQLKDICVKAEQSLCEYPELIQGSIRSRVGKNLIVISEILNKYREFEALSNLKSSQLADYRKIIYKDFEDNSEYREKWRWDLITNKDDEYRNLSNDIVGLSSALNILNTYKWSIEKMNETMLGLFR